MSFHRGGCSCPSGQTQGDACPVIREFRMTWQERQAAYRAELEVEQARRDGKQAVNVSHQLQKLGVPADNILALRAPKRNAAYIGAKQFVLAKREDVRHLILVGPHGCGKSTAAAAVLAEWVRCYDWNGQPSGGRQLPPMAWANAAEVTQETNFGRVNPDWLDGLRLCRLLVLDDLGKDGTAPGLGALRDLLVARHEAHRPTVLTANMAPTDFSARYGQSFYERIRNHALLPDLRSEPSLRKRPEARP